MGSLVELHQHLRDDSHMDMVVPKSEPNHEGSCSSSVSTPEPDGEAVVQDATQRQKRKGGRKPIYATSEERKQRNRQAQAAFRERRTEYIKQLETTIKHNEDTLQSLQQSHRSAADECLMLRYKNSLLERILLEKGIDVQAELRLKSGSPNPPPSKLAGSLANQASPLQRTAASRQHRHNAGIAPKLEQTNVPQAHREGLYNIHSPQLQPTPPSHTSSPSTTKSPSFAFQGGMSPTGTDIQAQQQQQHNSHPHQRPPLLPQPGPFSQGSRPVTAAPSDSLEPLVTSQSNMPGSTLNTTRMPPAYYLSPFQKHYDQLGKLTPPLLSVSFTGSCVRPRLIPFVQSRSMTHKPIWSMIQTPMSLQM